MQAGQPSRTARSAAAHRAAHQLLEDGRIFADPLAVPVLGEPAAAIVEDARADPLRRPMRLFIAARSRFAEDSLARAVARGVDQLVVLGAGLDTFGCRNPHPGLQVFELDHPATQTWKRWRLADAGIGPPATLRFVPVDFERETLAATLATAGFDADRPAFFFWLGVVPYLTEPAVFATLAAIAALPRGTQVVFDYGDPPAARPAAQRALHAAYAARVAAAGEPWISYFEPADLAARLHALGLTEIEDLGPAEIARRYVPQRAVPAAGRGGHILRAGRL